MKIKHGEISIDPEAPFISCKLGREKYAKVLTSIVTTYAEGFVLAINNEWGTGKTTFVRMWLQHLKNEGFQTVYFNAWENDFGNSPLASLISELNPLVKKRNNKNFKTVIEKGAILTKNTLPKIAKAIASKYVDVEGIVDAIEGTTKSLADILEQEIHDYAKKKAGLKDFRESLTAFIHQIKGDKPLIFIIDELDRCRPNYSVEILEQIKHFFTVPGIVFVLSIDKIQLGNAVRGVYGSDRIDAEEYLKRFIDIEYSLPAPSTSSFCEYLFNYFGFESFFFSEGRKGIREFHNDSSSFLKTATILFDKSNLTLRQQEKLFAHARLGLNSFNENHYVFPELYIMLVYLKNYKPAFYQNLIKSRLTFEELIKEFSTLLPKGISEEDLRGFIFIEALLVFFYNNSLQVRSKREIVSQDKDTGREVAFIESQIDKTEGQTTFTRFLQSLSNNWNLSRVGIDFLSKRIDMIEEVIK